MAVIKASCRKSLNFLGQDLLLGIEPVGLGMVVMGMWIQLA